jgi:hypothetical protein
MKPRLKKRWLALALLVLAVPVFIRLISRKSPPYLGAPLSPADLATLIRDPRTRGLPGIPFEETFQDPDLTAHVAGRIVTPDGNPIVEKCSIASYYESSRGEAHTTGCALNAWQVEANGHFTLRAHPGTNFLLFSIGGYPDAWVGPLSLEAQRPVSDLTVRLEKGFDARVQLTSPQGMRPSGGLVEVYKAIPWMPTERRQAPILADGSFVLPNASTTHLTMEIRADGFEFQQFDEVALNTEGDTELTLTPTPPATLRIVSDATGEPIEGATVRPAAWVGASNQIFPGGGDLWGESDAEGHAVLASLAAGDRYWFHVAAPGFAPALMGPMKAGEDVGEVRLGPPIVVSGKVILSGHPNGPISIRWSQPFHAETLSGHSHKYVQMDGGNGEFFFRVEGLRAGPFELDVPFDWTVPAYSTDLTESVHGLVLSMHGARIDPSLPPTPASEGEIRGRVLFPEGHSWTPAKVNVLIVRTSGPRYATVIPIGPDGRFDGRCPAGECWLGVSAEGYAPSVVGLLPLGPGEVADDLRVELMPGFDGVVEFRGPGGNIPTSGIVRATSEFVSDVAEFSIDKQGAVSIPHCGNVSPDLLVFAPGYQPAFFEGVRLKEGEPTRLKLAWARPIPFTIQDAATGKPIEGARILYEDSFYIGRRWYRLPSPQNDSTSPNFQPRIHAVCARSDAEGYAAVALVSNDCAYRFQVCAEGYGSRMLRTVEAGGEPTLVELGPPITVSGEIRAPEEALNGVRLCRHESRSFSYNRPGLFSSSSGSSRSANTVPVPLSREGDRLTFIMEDLPQGLLDLTVEFGDGAPATFRANVKSSIEGIVITPEGVADQGHAPGRD